MMLRTLVVVILCGHCVASTLAQEQEQDQAQVQVQTQTQESSPAGTTLEKIMETIQAETGMSSQKSARKVTNGAPVSGDASFMLALGKLMAERIAERVSLSQVAAQLVDSSFSSSNTVPEDPPEVEHLSVPEVGQYRKRSSLVRTRRSPQFSMLDHVMSGLGFSVSNTEPTPEPQRQPQEPKRQPQETARGRSTPERARYLSKGPEQQTFYGDDEKSGQEHRGVVVLHADFQEPSGKQLTASLPTPTDALASSTTPASFLSDDYEDLEDTSAPPLEKPPTTTYAVTQPRSPGPNSPRPGPANQPSSPDSDALTHELADISRGLSRVERKVSKLTELLYRAFELTFGESEETE